MTRGIRSYVLPEGSPRVNEPIVTVVSWFNARILLDYALQRRRDCYRAENPCCNSGSHGGSTTTKKYTRNGWCVLEEWMFQISRSVPAHLLK